MLDEMVKGPFHLTNENEPIMKRREQFNGTAKFGAGQLLALVSDPHLEEDDPAKYFNICLNSSKHQTGSQAGAQSNRGGPKGTPRFNFGSTLGSRFNFEGRGLSANESSYYYEEIPTIQEEGEDDESRLRPQAFLVKAAQDDFEEDYRIDDEDQGELIDRIPSSFLSSSASKNL